MIRWPVSTRNVTTSLMRVFASGVWTIPVSAFNQRVNAVVWLVSVPSGFCFPAKRRTVRPRPPSALSS